MDRTRLEAAFRGTVLTIYGSGGKKRGVGFFYLYFQDLEDVFPHWPDLLEMDLRGNPVCKIQKYRELLTTMCRSLGEI